MKKKHKRTKCQWRSICLFGSDDRVSSLFSFVRSSRNYAIRCAHPHPLVFFPASLAQCLRTKGRPNEMFNAERISRKVNNILREWKKNAEGKIWLFPGKFLWQIANWLIGLEFQQVCLSIVCFLFSHFLRLRRQRDRVVVSSREWFIKVNSESCVWISYRWLTLLNLYLYADTCSM